MFASKQLLSYYEQSSHWKWIIDGFFLTDNFSVYV